MMDLLHCQHASSIIESLPSATVLNVMVTATMQAITVTVIVIVQIVIVIVPGHSFDGSCKCD